MKKKWTAQFGTTLFGRVAMIVCWYFDGGVQGSEEDYPLAAKLVKLLPKVLHGNFRALDDGYLFALYDALASWPEPDKMVDPFFYAVKTEFFRRAEKADLDD